MDRIQQEVESIAQVPVKIDQELFKTGPLDSLNIINLLTFIESEYNLTIEPFDITLESFDTVEKIAHYVASKNLK